MVSELFRRQEWGKMIEAGEFSDKIVLYTGLTVEQVHELKEKIQLT